MALRRALLTGCNTAFLDRSHSTLSYMEELSQFRLTEKQGQYMFTGEGAQPFGFWRKIRSVCFASTIDTWAQRGIAFRAAGLGRLPAAAERKRDAHEKG